MNLNIKHTIGARSGTLFLFNTGMALFIGAAIDGLESLQNFGILCTDLGRTSPRRWTWPSRIRGFSILKLLG